MNSSETRPTLIYDGRCGFCATWVAYWRERTGEQVRYAPSQEVGLNYPEISAEDFKRSVWLVYPDGRRSSGAEAVFRLLDHAPGKRWPLRLYLNVPGFAFLSELAYRIVARNRSLFYRLMRIVWRA
jgi:predicted DCC family thiol-disulfide oxidoreductase YuxK